ncbi:hypothetical protein [Brucella intermedia]|uniref:hypothetical protein n=1 Tax=Brucella intermedia TaxID=94625 RepID=UPI00124CBBEC|nr:hypothetical protein [Brucella intermedia]KAB2733478.1 hypothetical protein F9L02_00420 [Brucella intermedia]
MKAINTKPQLYLSGDPLVGNQKPNADLKNPTLSPSKIGVNEEDFVIFITVPPYKNMKLGDNVYVNIGLYTSAPYNVGPDDVGNDIIFLIKKEQLESLDMEPDTTIQVSYVVPAGSVEGYPSVSNISEESGLKFYSDATLGLTPPNLSSSMSYATEPPQSLPPVSSAVVLQYVDELTENDILYLYAIVGDGEYVHQTRINYRNSSVSPANSYKSILIPSKDLFPHAGKKIALWYTINTGANDGGALYKSTTTEIDIPNIISGLPVEILNKDLSQFLSTSTTSKAYLGNYSLYISIPPYIDMSSDDYIVLNANNDYGYSKSYELSASDWTIDGNSKIKIDTYAIISNDIQRRSGSYFFINYTVYKNDGRKIIGDYIYFRYA